MLNLSTDVVDKETTNHKKCVNNAIYIIMGLQMEWL